MSGTGSNRSQSDSIKTAPVALPGPSARYGFGVNSRIETVHDRLISAVLGAVAPDRSPEPDSV